MVLEPPPSALMTWNVDQPVKLPFASTIAAGQSWPDMYVFTSLNRKL